MTRTSTGIAVLPLIYAAFISIGLPDGMLGAAWPRMRAEFGIGLNANWLMLVLSTCGSTISSFSSGFVLRRWRIDTVLVMTVLLTAGAILACAVGESFLTITVVSFFLGLGNGAIDAGLNHFAARNLSSRHMNWLHGFWGVGVSLGTLIVSASLAVATTWRTAYFVVGGLQLALALVLEASGGSLARSREPSSLERRSEHHRYRETLGLPSAWASMAAFFVYGGVECGTGLWIVSLLHDGRGWSVASAGLMATLYWASLTVGRFSIGVISRRTTPMRIVRAAVLAVIIGTGLIAASSWMAGNSWFAGLVTAGGLIITGFGLSPIFPMLVYDTPRAVGPGHALNLTGFEMGSGNLGFTLLPIALGTLMREYSIEWLGRMLLALALSLLSLLVIREHHVKRRQAVVDPNSPSGLGNA